MNLAPPLALHDREFVDGFNVLFGPSQRSFGNPHLPGSLASSALWSSAYRVLRIFAAKLLNFTGALYGVLAYIEHVRSFGLLQNRKSGLDCK